MSAFSTIAATAAPAFVPPMTTARFAASPDTLLPFASLTVIVIDVAAPAEPAGTTALLAAAFAAPALTALAYGLPPMCVPFSLSVTWSVPAAIGT